ncbi:hypothetical protein MTO96_037036 [Rhipicephalus appendiculatus]
MALVAMPALVPASAEPGRVATGNGPVSEPSRDRRGPEAYRKSSREASTLAVAFETIPVKLHPWNSRTSLFSRPCQDLEPTVARLRRR